MCGIAGFASLPLHMQGHEQAHRVLAAMAGALRHRGPDDEGIWHESDECVGFAHRRLAILDLSAAGHQPMRSACGRYVIVLNGEIYNFTALKQSLDAADPSLRWRGHSDTEVILAAFSAWGVEKTLAQLVGMFAFALWDREERRLHLARDRVGEKPLYYGWAQQTFVFASELKALRAAPGFDNAINRSALALYMRHSAVPAPHSIYENVFKLPPACLLTLSEQDLTRRELPQPKPYWRWLDVAREGVAHPTRFESEAAAIDALEAVLRQSVAGQMVADVPLGAFLSGGVDSSTVVALMQAQSTRPVKTFTIGFHEAAYDEAQHAKAVARHLGTDHTELYVTPEDALGVVPRLPEIYCEPFADCSQVPTFLLSQLTRQHVTVSLSGDGGDELFGGYSRYFLASRLWAKIARVPKPARALAAHAIQSLSPAAWDALYSAVASLLPGRYRVRLPGEKLYKGADALQLTSGAQLHRRLASHWEPSEVVIGGIEPETSLTAEAHGLPSLTEQMMALDAVTYLPDDILVKVDRAAMALSLETRVPFLDHRVVEFAWRLPLSTKIRDGHGKWILRQVLDRYVPRELVERPKMGFAVPIDAWLRGPLREWAETLLDESRLKREGYFQPAPIRRKWWEHLSGQRDWQYHLWDVLMFQAWLEGQPSDT